MVQRRHHRRDTQAAGRRASVKSAPSRHGDAIAVAMQDGVYERNEQDFMRLVVRHGMHVVDVGAHIGFHTSHLAGLVDAIGSVTAFEPVAEYSTVLADMIRARGWGSRVRLVRAAAGDIAGTQMMVVDGPALARPNAYLDDESVSEDDDKVRRVLVVRLDDAISNRPVGFLKIDAEGAEALVLRGARRLLAEDRPVVLVDLHPHLMAHLDGTTPAALIHQMARLDYECRLLGAGVPGPAVADIHARGVTTVVFLPRVPGRPRL
jgi:FkbM family methyltransferase